MFSQLQQGAASAQKKKKTEEDNRGTDKLLPVKESIRVCEKEGRLDSAISCSS